MNVQNVLVFPAGTEMGAALIDILSDYINNRPSSDISISEELIKLAQAHQVIPIVYYQTKDKKLYQPYLQAISAYTQRKKLLSQIKDALGDIPFYTVKGISAAQYYPVPQLRTMGDCDIVVHESDIKELKREVLNKEQYNE